MMVHLFYLWTGVGPALANHLWQSTVFVAAAWTMTLLLRTNRAYVRYMFWLVSSAKLLVPFSLLIGLGGFLQRPQHAAIGSQPTLYSVVDVMTQPFSRNMMLPVVSKGYITSLGERFATCLPVVTVAVWLCGAVTVLLIWYARWRRVSAMLGRAVSIEQAREVEILRRMEGISGLRTRIPVLRSQEAMEPGIFGIFRPILMWPDRLSELLEDQHIEAILAHEMTHVKHRDNLAATLHMMVEAAFWFYPIVWWIEKRIVEERERACDEAVVQLGNSAAIYAEGLLKACRFCVESPLVCVSGIKGADLKTRVARIMTASVALKLDLSRRLLICAVGTAVVATPLAIGLMTAPQGRPKTEPVEPGATTAVAFAVASIKPDKSHSGAITIQFEPDGFSATNIPLRPLIREAYGVQDPEIVGGPSWIDSATYDIHAKVEDTDVAALKHLTFDQRRQMLRPILEDRFKLRIHWEMKVLPIYALVIAKNGPKLEKAKVSASAPQVSVGPNLPMPAPIAVRMTGRGQIQGADAPIDLLVKSLARQPELGGRKILDKTGLTDQYDWELHWTPEDPAPLTGHAEAGRQGNTSPPDSSGPSIFTAIQEQLGLKLESQKAPVSVLVIDHVEQPSEN